MSPLDRIRKEAKRFLKTLRENPNNGLLLKRLRANYPNAPARPGLRVIQHALARERGYESWAALKAALAVASEASVTTGQTPVATFLQLACWDQHSYGRGTYANHEAAAMRMLAKTPDLARESLYTAIVCGEIDTMRRLLDAQPDLVHVKGGPRRWEPLLYLCGARLPLPALRDHAIAMARDLLDRGANPNAYYMAGDAIYSALVSVAGEGEQDGPPHPQRDALYALLLQRGAEPFDIQVLYNTFFRGDVLWWLELTYAHTMGTEREAAWRDPEWLMLNMGGYGSGARFLLETAINKGNVVLAEWLLSHGASPNAAPARANNWSRHSLYEHAIRQNQTEIAALLQRYGATSPTNVVLDEGDALVVAALRLDRNVARQLIEANPGDARSAKAMYEAARRDRADAVALLLDLGVPIEIEHPARQRTLHIAAAQHALRVATLLIARGAEIDPVETEYGGTPIGFAAYRNDREMIDLLTPVSRNVWTLVHLGKLDRLRELLREDPAPARQVFDNGTTLLWWVPEDETLALEIVDLLIAHGADPSLRSGKGTTAADYARTRGLDRLADRLDRAAATAAATAGGADAVATAPVAAATATTAPTATADAAADAGDSSADAASDDTHRSAQIGLTRGQYDRLASDLSAAYATGDAAALQRLNAHYRRTFTQDDVRAGVWKRVRRVREAQGAAEAFHIGEARELVAHDAGYGSWATLTKALAAGTPPAPAFAIDARKQHVTLHRPLQVRDWDALVDAMTQQRLTSLDANGHMNDAGLARIASLDHVTRLSLGGSRELSDDGLRQLARMPQLQELDLNEYPGGRLTDRGLAVLQHLPELRHFEMTWQRAITDAGVANLRHCPHLEHINLMGTPTGDGALEALAGKTALRRLNTGRMVTDAGLPRLHDIPHFARWQGGAISYGVPGAQIGPTHLMLDGPFTDAGLHALAGLDGLFSLGFFWHIPAMTAHGLAVVTALPNLGVLWCGDRLCDDNAMHHISAIPTLRMLQAQGAVATDAGFTALSRSRTLEYVWGRDWEHLTGVGFRALSRMPALRGLAVELKQVDDAALAALPDFPALRELTPMGVQDAGFQYVGRCTALERLTMMYCRDTTDRATEQIGGLTRLTRYYAGATQITDRSLELLARLPALESIEIYECLNVTDAGLTFLARMPQLREVSFSGLPHVTQAGTALFGAGVNVGYWP